jgi:hypothetical protein
MIFSAMSRPSGTFADAATLEYVILKFLGLLPRQYICLVHSITEAEICTSAMLFYIAASVLQGIYTMG